MLLNCQDYLGLLGLDVKNWSLDRRPQNGFKGAIWTFLQVEMGSVTSRITLTERAESQGSWGCLLGCPLMSFLSTMIASPDIWSQLRREFSH
jgi:hypothetical protein